MDKISTKILLIEDNPGDVFLLKERLSQDDGRTFLFEITLAESLAESVKLLTEDLLKFDLILLDLTLPDSSGLDTLINVKKIAEETPIIVLTGLCDEEIGFKAVQTGAQDYLIKGQFDDKLLVKSIRYATERHGLLMELKKIRQREVQICEAQVVARTFELKMANEKLQQEILERKKMQDVLREREERYRALAENTYDLIFETDIESRYLYASPNTQEVLGYGIFELLGRYYYDFIHPDDLESVKMFFKTGFKSKTGDEINYKFRHKNGYYLLLESTGKIYQTAMNELRAVIVTRDITAKKKIEEEMLKSSKLESLGTLAGGIAHDFNNILMGIIGNITLAKKRIDVKEKALEVMLRAEKVAYKAKGLTEQLITFSKGGMPIKRILSPCNLIVESVKFATTGSNTTVEFKIAEDLWSIEADEGQLEQVITNLTINAKQAMPDGGKITVRAENIELQERSVLPLPAGKYIRISIKDSGVGISPENISKIFDPYFTTKQDGSGLGLSTSYSIIKNHNGTITLDSKLNHGSTFYVYLPGQFGAAVEAVDMDEKGNFDFNKTLLIMDDDETVLTPISEMLSDLGYRVITARSGKEAIETYVNCRNLGIAIDVVIMDLVVQGGMGGREAVEKLLKIDPDVKAIVSSGYSNDPVMSDYKNFGFRGVLAKPYQSDEMNDVIRKITSEI